MAHGLIHAPVVMRDIDAYEKKFQVGEGTYGSVFVARDRSSNEIVALKRINTEQEENGFPITALREVKLLKGLKHPNMVLLKEIVCSKGTYHPFATNKRTRLEVLSIVRIPSLLRFRIKSSHGFDALFIVDWRDIIFHAFLYYTPRVTA
jgi:serine/threonine protein kinase